MTFIAGLLVGFGIAFSLRRHRWVRHGYVNGQKDRDALWREALRTARP